MFTSEVLVALIGLAGVIVTAVSTVFIKMRTQNRQYAKELKYRSNVISLKIEFSDWNVIQKEIKSLMKTTNINRFFIFNAYNGIDDPKWTTGIYQVVEGQRDVVSYVHFELDHDYVRKLKEMRREGHLSVSCDDIEDGLLKSVYHAEGVRHSVWFPIVEQTMSDAQTVGISYCSFASYDDEISEDTLINCKRIVDMLKSAIANANPKEQK